MKLRELVELSGLRGPRLRADERRLARLHSLDDLRRAAARRTPRPVFDYVEGGADGELSLERNVAAFREWELVPLAPRDVSEVSTTTTLFGQELSLPLVCGPTGYTRMIHQAGELGVARAAARAGLPYGLSTVAATSIEDVANSGHRNLWFQLYVWRDRDMTRSLVDRAWRAGYRVLEVSVDVPVAGMRTRDVRNGLTVPPQLTPRTLWSVAVKPGYWLALVRNPMITFANAPPGVARSAGRTIHNVALQFDPSVDLDDIAELRSLWPGTLLVKGLMSPHTAAAAIAAGADGVHLSNHGGRQLDRIAPPLEFLPEVRAAVGEEPTVIIDSGIRDGTDLAIAIALGADAGAIGRAYLYGLMAAGEPGVDLVLRLFAEQFRRALALLGVVSVGELRERGTSLLHRRAKPTAP
jgi:L-lactate dehydrogenase (cytochrome)